jgi:hypothetical protein
LSPGFIILKLVVGGFVWWFILGTVLKDQHLEFKRVMFWYGLAWAVGLGVDLLGSYVLRLPRPLTLLLRVLARTLVIYAALKIEYSAWDPRRLCPAVVVYAAVEFLFAVPSLYHSLTDHPGSLQ